MARVQVVRGFLYERGEKPVIRKGVSGVFHDKGLEGASHHAVIPNVNTVDDLRDHPLSQDSFADLSRGL